MYLCGMPEVNKRTKLWLCSDTHAAFDEKFVYRTSIHWTYHRSGYNVDLSGQILYIVF